MIKQFLKLEWKAFFRSPTFQVNLFLKILMGLGVLYMVFVFAAMGIGVYFGLTEMEMEPLETVNKYIIYYLAFDLVLRYFIQKMPIINIKPFLLLPLKKSRIVNVALGKTAGYYFNWLPAFFLIPFSIILVMNGYELTGVLAWHIGIMALIYINNFINIFLNNVTVVVLFIAALFAISGGLHYKGYFDITNYTKPFFHGMYASPWMAIIPVLILCSVAYSAFLYFKKRIFLDSGLSEKIDIATTDNMAWLDRFGKLSTFLKNDIKLLMRNKRSKKTVFISVLFLFYGLLFFTGAVKTYDGVFWRMFAAIFVTGGFLFSFGQFVPSWDSSYYPLMMTQNISYKEYLKSKWLLMVLATMVSTILCIPYLYFGWEVLAAIVAGSIFNMGINTHLVLLGGAFIKTPIDLTSGKKAFGDKNSFNLKVLLISLPKMFGPMALYAIGHYTWGPVWGFVLVAIVGCVGFAFRDIVFNMIIKIYKKEKYKTLQAYKQAN